MRTRRIYEPNTQMGNFTFLYETEMGRGRNRRAMFRCICGKEYEVGISKIKHTITSCGCLYGKEARRSVSVKHGMGGTPEYECWLGAKARCRNKLNPAYVYYGGRGIRVCERWKDSFENFYADMGKKPTAKHSLDRIDVNGNYEPSNCRWTTVKEQCNNRRSNVVIELYGKRLTATQWSEKIKIHAKTIMHRKKAGWSNRDIIYKPILGTEKRVCAFKIFA